MRFPNAHEKKPKPHMTATHQMNIYIPTHCTHEIKSILRTLKFNLGVLDAEWMPNTIFTLHPTIQSRPVD